MRIYIEFGGLRGYLHVLRMYAWVCACVYVCVCVLCVSGAHA